jgi:hypothetical protein
MLEGVLAMILARALDMLGGLALQSNEGVGVVGTIIYLAVVVLFIAAMWIVFQKGGQPGWAAIIPLYNTICLLRIVGRPWWWLLLLLIPVVNFIILIIVMLDLAKSFGKGSGFAIGLIFLAPIFILILAFGSARYVGPAGKPA